MNARMRDAAHRAPFRDLLRPLLRRNLRQRHAPLDAERAGVAPGLLDVAVEPVHDGLRVRAGPEVRHPAIRETGGAAHDHLALAPHPDGDRALDRQWIDPGVGHAVPLSLEGHQLLRPQGPHDVDLFLDALPPILELLAQGLELDRVPPDADTETKPS